MMPVPSFSSTFPIAIRAASVSGAAHVSFGVSSAGFGHPGVYPGGAALPSAGLSAAFGSGRLLTHHPWKGAAQRRTPALTWAALRGPGSALKVRL